MPFVRLGYAENQSKQSLLQHDLHCIVGVWHMPDTCTAYAGHLYSICQTPVQHMPDTHIAYYGNDKEWSLRQKQAFLK